MDLLKVLLRSPFENEGLIDTIFSKVLDPIGEMSRLSPKNESEMTMFKGFYQFMLGGGEENNEEMRVEAIRTWKRAFEMMNVVGDGGGGLQNLFKVGMVT